MVWKKVRTQFLLLKNTHTHTHTHTYGKDKSKNSIVTFHKNPKSKEKVRTRFLLYEKKIT